MAATKCQPFPAASEGYRAGLRRALLAKAGRWTTACVVGRYVKQRVSGEASAAHRRTSGGRAALVGYGIVKCAPVMAAVTVREGCGLADVAATPSMR
jgi:hypothetical protein